MKSIRFLIIAACVLWIGTEVYAQDSTTVLVQPVVKLTGAEYLAQGFSGSDCREFTYSLSGGSNWILLDTAYDKAHIQINSAALQSNKLVVKVNKALLFDLRLTYDGLPTPLVVTIDNKIISKLTPKDNYFFLETEGGIPPYTVSFVENGLSVPDNDAIFRDIPNQWIIKEEVLLNKGITGDFSELRVSDADGDDTEEVTVPIKLTVKQSYLSQILIIIGVILIGLLIYLYISYKKRKYKQMAKPLKERYERERQTIENNLEESVVGKKIGKIDISEKINVNSTKAPLKTGANRKIKITRKDTGNDGQLELENFEVITRGDYFAVPLNQWWENSLVDQIYLSPIFVDRLTNFLKNQKLDQVKEEKVGVVPEVGGFMNTEEKFNLAFEKFVPFVPEYNDVFRIEIGTATLVQELGDAQDKYPDMAVLGWFHTHPGHGLFLSNADLAVQKHFPSMYQVAMEIDSMTPQLDTAFFSYNSGGFPNNYHVKKQHSSWMSWVNLVENH